MRRLDHWTVILRNLQRVAIMGFAIGHGNNEKYEMSAYEHPAKQSDH